MAALSLLIWPFRMVWRYLRRRGQAKPLVKRLIIVGFDGQDPKLTEEFMQRGLLPNMEKLAKAGCYTKLGTTYPAISPVAWSSFATGTNPARHNIFDFLDRDRRNYLPLLSSTHIGSVEKSIKIGSYRIPLNKPEVRLLRRSKPFWSILGEHSIWSTVLRVPITFPPDKFYGAQLSAMCVPDLLGTQARSCSTRPAKRSKSSKKAACASSSRKTATAWRRRSKAPENLFKDGNPPLEVPLAIDIDRGAGKARVTVDGESVELEPMKLSEWIPLSFKAAPTIKVSGICRMMVTEMDDEFSLYVTPINIDPEKPAMPISHPSYYSTYLAKKVGHFCTLGLAEDTWALNEGVTDDGTFLQQTYDIDRERQDMFFASLDRLKQGSLVCVFDATDRIQHMFWHYLEKEHPANKGKAIDDAEHKDAIEAIYKHNDVLVGKVMEKLKKGDVLMVLSDHGFNSFQRGVNLNGWLHKEGFLVLKEGATGEEEWLQGVDWSKTKAYSLGLTGMFLNMKGREAQASSSPARKKRKSKRRSSRSSAG